MIVFDTETTACKPNQICQLAYLVVFAGDRIVGRNYFFTVDAMNEHAQNVHGFTRDKLKALSASERFSERAEQICEEFIGARTIVGHNVSYDVRALSDELERAGTAWKPKSTLCTMKHFSRMMNLHGKDGKPKPPKLSELAEYLDVRKDRTRSFTEQVYGEGLQAHDARYDACLTYLCLVAARETGQLRGLLR